MAENREKTYVADVDRSIYDIRDAEHDAYRMESGLTPEIVDKLSKEKGDPVWMQQFRLQSLQIYNELRLPDWGPSLEGLDIDHIATYVRPNTKMQNDWANVPQDIKNMFGHFAYLLEGVKDLETLCPYPMKITADGEVFEGEYLFGAVCNSTSIAGLMKLSPDAVDLCDGQFELMLVPVPKTPLQLQRTIRAIVYEEYETSNALIFRHVRHVTAESDGSIPWTLDGEYAPGVPKIEIGIEDNGIQMMI